MAEVLKKIWNIYEGVNFQELKNNMAVVKFKDRRQLNRIMDTGPWLFDKAALLMRRWDDQTKPEEMRFDKLKIWVQIHNLSIGLLKDEIARDFAELAGRICRNTQKESDIIKGEFARYQIEVNVEEPLLSGCYLETKKGEHVWIEFRYEKKPSVCSRCGVITHRGDVCSPNLSEDEAEEGKEEEPLQEEEKEAEPHQAREYSEERGESEAHRTQAASGGGQRMKEGDDRRRVNMAVGHGREEAMEVERSSQALEHQIDVAEVGHVSQGEGIERY